MVNNTANQVSIRFRRRIVDWCTERKKVLVDSTRILVTISPNLKTPSVFN